MRKIETNDWWPQLVALKDDLSLRELAEKFDVTPGAVSAALKRNGIKRQAAPPGPRSRRKQALPPEPGESKSKSKSKAPTKAKAPAKTKAPSKAKAPAKTAKKAGGRSKAHLIEPYSELLGKRPDGDIAKKAGVSVRTIANYRTQRGIDGYTGPKRRGKDRKPRRSKIDPYQELLGQVPDRVVAEKAGVSLNAVRNYRVKKGIAARGRGRPKAGSVPPPGKVRPGRSSGGQVAWKATMSSGDVVVVLAGSLSEAVEQAERSGDVNALERVGRVVQ